MARMRLRRFLYLDGDLTSEYLAQAEGGIYEEEDQATSGSTEKGAGLGAAVGPVSGKAGASSERQESRARKVRQTEESAFSRLAALLDDADSVQWLEAFDDEIWGQLGRGEVLEIECQLQVPKLIQFTQIESDLDAMKELMGMTDEKLDEDALQGFAVLGLINQMLDGLPVFARALGSPNYSFIATLDRKHLRVPIDELQGEARLYCSLERKLRDDQQYSIVDTMPALRNLPDIEDAKRELLKNEMLSDSAVDPPAAIVSPIAIFR